MVSQSPFSLDVHRVTHSHVTCNGSPQISHATTYQ